jgi:hypothetical protein
MARIKAVPTSRLQPISIIRSSPLQGLQYYSSFILGVLGLIVLLNHLTIFLGLIMVVLPAEIYLAYRIYTGFLSRTPLLELIELSTPLHDLEDTRAITAGGRPPNATDGIIAFTK